MIGLGDLRFIILGRQYGCRALMWQRSMLNFFLVEKVGSNCYSKYSKVNLYIVRTFHIIAQYLVRFF